MGGACARVVWPSTRHRNGARMSSRSPEVRTRGFCSILLSILHSQFERYCIKRPMRQSWSVTRCLKLPGSYAKAFVKAYSSSSSFAKAYSVGDPAESAVGDPERIRPKWSGSGMPTNPRRRSKIEDRRRNDFEGEEEPNEIDRSTPK